jgi:hypothetical protein
MRVVGQWSIYYVLKLEDMCSTSGEEVRITCTLPKLQQHLDP